jgi:hypothetical protein
MGISQTKALREAAERGCKITVPYFKRLKEVGLIPGPEGDSYPDNLVDRLVRIRELGQERGYKPLDRRVVYLRGEHDFSDIPPDVLRTAMLKVVASMTSPVRKSRLVLAAHEEWDRAPLGRNNQGTDFRLRPDWRPPTSRSALANAIGTAKPYLFVMHVGGAYVIARVISGWQGTKDKLARVRFEEQVVILAAREMSGQMAMRSPEATEAQQLHYEAFLRETKASG